MTLDVWDGRSKSRQTDKYAAPDADDWDQIIKEVANTQKAVIETQNIIIENNNIYSNFADEQIKTGQPLVLQTNSRLLLADTNIQSEIAGISIIDCEINETCIYITQGRLTLANWSLITGEEKLIPGRNYFLSMEEKGKLVSIAPHDHETVVAQVGRAQSQETLNIGIEIPIYLS